MVIVAVFCGGFGSVTLFLAFAVALHKGIVAALFPLGMAGFSIAGLVKVIWDWRHPKLWQLWLEDGTLCWLTPDEQGQVDLKEVAEMSFVDTDYPRLTIIKAMGGKYDVHPNCLGNLRLLRTYVAEHCPHIRVRYW